jgi:hypothetical protein
MPGTPGPRTGLAQILSSGEAPTILRTEINSIISWLEGNAAITSFGLLSAMPTSTPASPGIAGRRYRATNAFATFRDTGTGWELEAQTPQIVTALPTPGGGIPFDGQEVLFLADATNGVLHRFRYRAAAPAPYRWEFVGGSPLEAESSAAGTRASTAYGDLAGTSVGPALTPPLAGDYLVTVEANIQNNAGEGRIAPQFGAAAVNPDDAAAGGESSNLTVDASKTSRRTIAAAGTTVTARYAASASTATFGRRRLLIVPVRVG